MPKQTSKAAPDLAMLSEQIGEAEHDRETYEVELERLPDRLQQASCNGDVEAIVGHRRRMTDLPNYIDAVSTHLLHLRIASLDLRIARAKAEQPAIDAPTEALEVAAKKAAERLGEARLKSTMAYNAIKEWELDRAQYMRQLPDLDGPAATDPSA